MEILSSLQFCKKKLYHTGIKQVTIYHYLESVFQGKFVLFQIGKWKKKLLSIPKNWLPSHYYFRGYCSQLFWKTIAQQN